jgi:hypothetical protein
MLKVFPVIFNWPMACAWMVSGFAFSWARPTVPASKSNPASVAPAVAIIQFEIRDIVPPQSSSFTRRMRPDSIPNFHLRGAACTPRDASHRLAFRECYPSC